MHPDRRSRIGTASIPVPSASSWTGGAPARAGKALALALALTGGACKLDPPTPQVHYSLSAQTRAVGDDGRPLIPLKVQEHIRGSLEMLFGTPQHPQYMLLEEWIEEDYDPNYPSYEVGDQGSGELSAEDLERIREDNHRRFRRELAAIDAGRFEDAQAPDSAPDLWEAWREMLRGTPPKERGEGFADEARELFLGWYPTLRDSAELYRLQCLHCHGPEGGGDGPTADFLDPRPRDYRMGIFKFTAVKDKALPRRADLAEILTDGVAGTAMPSFKRFSEAEIQGLVDYVRLLAVRGMVERDLAVTYDQDGVLAAEYVAQSYRDTWERWSVPQEKVIVFEGEVPPPTKESIARGRELFIDPKTGNCASCHGERGRGDGVSAFTVDPDTGKTISAYQDDWGVDIVPRDLTRGVFRGGRRPIDIYRRIYAGINGTPMPALGESLDAEGNPLLSKDDLWALVHYVGSISEREPLATHSH